MRNATKIVLDELWGIMMRDGGVSLERVYREKMSVKRFGKMKKLLYRSIRESSLGMLNMRMYYFAGDIYEPISTNDFYNVIYQILAFKASLPDEDSVFDERIKAQCYQAVMSKDLELDNSIIVFRNCVLEVDGRKVHKFSKKWVQICRVDYDYEPNKRVYKWYDFLNSVLPEVEQQRVLQMFLGAVFVNRTEYKIQTMLILLGDGANGKSVIHETVRGVLGDENVSKSGIGELCHRGSLGDQTVMLINGKRLNYCSEIQSGEFDKNVDRLKQLISNEPLYGRKLYQDRSEVRNIPLIMANANRMPSISQKNYAILRRICVIPFKISIPETRQNPHLADELREEYPGIMNWILEGRDRLAEIGYKIPRIVDGEKARAEQVADFSSPIVFMKMNGWLSKFDNVDCESTYRMKLRDLYAKYLTWCDLNSKEVVTKNMFSRELRNAGYEKVRDGDGSSYKIFSRAYVDKLKRSRFSDSGALERKVREFNPVGTTMVIDGVLWASSMKAVAHVAGCGYSVVKKARDTGLFDGLTAADREKKMYNVRACIDKMHEHHLIGSDEEKARHREQQRMMKYERYIFNQAMQYHKLPYRKFGSDEPQLGGYVVVDDTMTEMEAYELAGRELGFDTSSVKASFATRGAYSRGGKGFLGDLQNNGKTGENEREEDFEEAE